MPLPSAFCWSKFGTEAGEEASSILQRKEVERREDGGTFLWGIGTSIRPSLMALLKTETDPVVVFTPMRARAAARDCAPDAVMIWQSASGLDGRPFALPANAVVSSSRNLRRHHYALVCHRESSLFEGPHDLWIDDRKLRNFRTGTRVGSSQVTSIVKVIDDARTEAARYPVAFEARLQAPYLVILEDGMPLRRKGTNTDDSVTGRECDLVASGMPGKVAAHGLDYVVPELFANLCNVDTPATQGEAVDPAARRLAGAFSR